MAGFAAIGLATAASASSGAGGPDSAIFEDLGSFGYATSRDVLMELDRAINNAGTDRAKLDAIEEGMLKVLADPETTFAASQAICERLGAILPANPKPADPALTVLEPMLGDARLVDLARLALDRVPGDAIDALYLKTLDSSDGTVRIAMVQSLGYRRVESAVPRLAKLAAAGDTQLKEEALVSLGEIGTTAALAALDAMPDASATEVVQAKLACLPRLPSGQARKLCESISGDARVRPSLRATAFKRLIELGPKNAVALVVEAIGGEDADRRRVAIEMINATEDPNLVSALCDKLSSWPANAQVAVIGALERKGDAGAVPAIMEASKSEDPVVRLAAINALGRLKGSADVAKRLADIVANGDVDEAKAAVQSLSWLEGAGVTNAVLDGAIQGDLKVRAVFTEETGLRHMMAALPILLGLRNDPEPAIRLAALGSLSSVAPAEEQENLLEWANGATDPSEVSKALHAFIDVSMRISDPNLRVGPVIELVRESGPDVQRRFIPVLARMGGSEAAKCVGVLAANDDRTVSTVASAALVRWPDDSALPYVVDLAETTKSDSVRERCVKAASGWLDADRTLASAELTSFVSRLLGAADGPDAAATRKHLALLLARASDTTAAVLAEKLTHDPVLAEEAQYALEVIGANSAATPVVEVSDNPGDAGYMVDGNEGTTWSVPATEGQWIRIDYGRSRPVWKIELDESGHGGDFPARYEAFVTDDPDDPGKWRASGDGARMLTTITFPRGTRGRYVIIRNAVERSNNLWSVTELQTD